MIVIFRAYKTEASYHATEIAMGEVTLVESKLKMRLITGDPYYCYSCVQGDDLDERVGDAVRLGKNELVPINCYVSSTPEPFVKNPYESFRTPPHYRFSLCPRPVCGETGWDEENYDHDDGYLLAEFLDDFPEAAEELPLDP